MTKQAEEFTPELNRKIAEAMLTPSSSIKQTWINNIAPYIMPYATNVTNAISLAVSETEAEQQAQADNAAGYLRAIEILYNELDDQERQSVDVQSVVIACLSSGLTMNDVYKVAAVKRGDPDNPSFQQAMKSKDRSG